MAALEELDQSREGLFGAEPGRRVNLDTVARRENDRLFRQAALAKSLENLRQARFRKGKPLPQRHGRRVVAQAENQDGHALLLIVDCRLPIEFGAGVKFHGRNSVRGRSADSLWCKSESR